MFHETRLAADARCRFRPIISQKLRAAFRIPSSRTIPATRLSGHSVKQNETLRETFFPWTLYETSRRIAPRDTAYHFAPFRIARGVRIRMQRFATFTGCDVACNGPVPRPCPKCPKMSRFSLFSGTFARYIRRKYGMQTHLCRIHSPRGWGILGHSGTFSGRNGDFAWFCTIFSRSIYTA
jgi:hypothetical protein